MSYIVRWEDEFPTSLEDETINDLESPLDAAKQALENIQSSMTLGFTVIDTKDNKKYSVDLSEDDEDAVLEIGDENTNANLLQSIQTNVDTLILRTPTGDTRNKICDINIKLLQIIENGKNT